MLPSIGTGTMEVHRARLRAPGADLVRSLGRQDITVQPLALPQTPLFDRVAKAKDAVSQ